MNKWIPIRKEAPKEKGEYITTTMYGEVYCDYWDGDRFDRTETVVAWQKLPAPFKSQERDDESCDEIWERAYKERDGEPQPEERTEERTETHECDCISRQLMYDMGATCIATRNKDGDLVALGALDILPSATPQPKEESQQKVGHWIEHKHGGIEHIECSECGIWFLKGNLIRKSYCPNCGSCNGDMIKNIMRDIAKTMSGGAKE